MEKKIHVRVTKDDGGDTLEVKTEQRGNTYTIKRTDVERTLQTPMGWT